MITSINSEAELKERLQRDIIESGRDGVVVQAGHFPLVYARRSIVEAIGQWGEFSPYTLELGAEAGRFAKDIGKDVEFAFFVDDHTYESVEGLGANRTSQLRNRLYRGRSGALASLPVEYSNILKRFGFDERDVLRHDHQKEGRRDCLYFSEKVLRASARQIENACAREYVGFIEDPNYFDKEKSHLISFVPQICRGHICDVALDQEVEGLSASHVFLESRAIGISRENLYNQGRGVSYRRD